MVNEVLAVVVVAVVNFRGSWCGTHTKNTLNIFGALCLTELVDLLIPPIQVTTRILSIILEVSEYQRLSKAVESSRGRAM